MSGYGFKKLIGELDVSEEEKFRKNPKKEKFRKELGRTDCIFWISRSRNPYPENLSPIGAKKTYFRSDRKFWYFLHHFHHFWLINQGYNQIMKVFGPNGRREHTLAENFSTESPVLVASRPPACSNGGTQDFLPNFSANSKFHFFSSDVSGHFSMTF